MPLYKYNGKLLVNGGALAIDEDCCCDECERCESFLVDDIDAPTITKYPETAIVTIANVVFTGQLTGCEHIPPADCDLCDDLNQI
jgi:hypothetical protein